MPKSYLRLMNLPSAFLHQMQEILAGEVDDFVESLSTTPPVSISGNSLKENFFPENFEKVKWNPAGVYLPERPIFTLDPVFHAGAYYVQEASSMFVAEVIEQINAGYKPLKILDLCAAPGGKSTLLLNHLNHQGWLLSNEAIKSRYNVLAYNLSKWGHHNTFGTNQDSQALEGLNGFFDVVLVDAPCSGEGLFRKDRNAMREWSPAQVEMNAARQKRILSNATRLVAPGGKLLYSTCTYNRQENEENVRWVLNNFPYKAITLSVPDDWGIVPGAGGYRFYPHRVQGEGFFIAAFENQSTESGFSIKPAANFKKLTPVPKHQLPLFTDWVYDAGRYRFFLSPAGNVIALDGALEQDALILDKFLPWMQAGLNLGSIKGKDFIPSAEFALSTAVSPFVPRVDVDKPAALSFLRKENFTAADVATGWQLITFQQHPLGWIKKLPQRVNNYYPKAWRILMSEGITNAE